MNLPKPSVAAVVLGIQEYTKMNSYFLPEQSIFRAYDIRGVVGKTLTPEVLFAIGLGIGSEAQDRGQKKIIVGYDGRLSGPSFAKAMADGLMASGCDVIMLGQVTSPMLYYATCVLETQSGVMITGSHNPPEYNGIKTVIAGKTIYGDELQEIYQRLVNKKLRQGQGSSKEVDILDNYIERIVSDIKLPRKMKVVIDCGNGVGGKVAPTLFKKIGCEVIPLFCEVDGTFPNHHPDPSVIENLRDIIAAVKANKADVGLAFDGDADRIGLVTNLGEVIMPDRTLIFLARDVLKRHPGAVIPFDVKCTRHLAEEITKHGGKPEMIQTGHAILKAKVKEVNAPVAGELSGHIFYSERWYGFDDGIYDAARIVELLSQDSRTCSEIFATIPDSINTPELKMDMADDKKFKFMEDFAVKAEFGDAKVITTDGLRIEFKDGFGLMRPSNTTPIIIFRFEGDTQEALVHIQKIFREQLLKFSKDLVLPF